MKTLVFVNLLILVLLGANMGGSIYNCVDCSYDNSRNMVSQEFQSRAFSIIYQEPKKVKVLTQNYSCENCGLFEISIRENVKTKK